MIKVTLNALSWYAEVLDCTNTSGLWGSLDLPDKSFNQINTSVSHFLAELLFLAEVHMYMYIW